MGVVLLEYVVLLLLVARTPMSYTSALAVEV